MHLFRLQFPLRLLFVLMLLIGVGIAVYLGSINYEAIAIARLKMKGAEFTPHYDRDGKIDCYQVVLDQSWSGSLEDFALLRDVRVRFLYVEGQMLTAGHARAINHFPTLAGIEVEGGDSNKAMMELLRSNFEGRIVDGAVNRRRKLMHTREEIDALFEEWKSQDEPPAVPPKPFQVHGGVI